jgi:glycosyltransferase involved in cell wall biosynthesis
VIGFFRRRPVQVSKPVDVTQRVKVLIRQPALPHYRLPLFDALSLEPGLDITVVYGTVENLDNAASDSFRSVYLRMRQIRFPLVGNIDLDTGLGRLVRAERPDVLLATWTPRIVTSAWHLLTIQRRGIPVVLWGHGYSKTPQPGADRARYWLARKAAGVVVYAPAAVPPLLSAGVSSDRVMVARNALDMTAARSMLETLTRDPKRLDAARLANGTTGAFPLICYVSRLDEKNQLDLLLEAMSEVLGTYPSAKAVIIGGGDSERIRLEGIASRQGIDRSVVFTGPIYDESSIAGYLAGATCFCYPSNAGLSLQHAWAYGLPTVLGDDATKHGPEFGDADDTNSILFEHGDSMSLANSLLRLAAHADLRTRLGQGAVVTSANLCVQSAARSLRDAVLRALAQATA